MQRKLLALSGIEGATVMAAELCGAKLLAPVFGGSLYVWASVMGVTLFALASGYFVGGWLSSKQGDNRKRLFRLLGFASLLTLAMPLISVYFIPALLHWPLLLGVILGTVALLFFPVFLLGASSPLFIVLQSNKVSDAGIVSGYVYAISTFGGIVSTFLCGFYLIPELGLRLTLITFGSILFISNLLILKSKNFGALIVLGFLLYCNYRIFGSGKDLIYKSEGIMGEVKVYDKNETKRILRVLSVNDIVQSEMDLKTEKSVSQYVNIIEQLLPSQDSAKKALVLGMGAGLTSNLLETFNYKVTAVEFDERIIQVAKKFFKLSQTVDVVHDDARRFINRNTLRFDIVLVDVFKAEEQPFHVLTLESLLKLKKQLNKDGRIIINWHGYTSGLLGEGTSILNRTLLSAGYSVKLCTIGSDEDHRNILVLASLHELPVQDNQIYSALISTNKINTDNYPVLEKANALANKRWRSLYLNYYYSTRN